jgi:flavin reductase (DIM6/NTAB) family NADH-FMN oxidoreductase RutF/rubredoxin
MNTKAFRKHSYGLYIVSSRSGERLNGQIANTVFQVSSDPATIAVSLNKKNLTHDYVRESRVFSVSVLSKGAPMAFIGRFGFKGGRDVNKFEGTGYRIGTSGAPIVTDFSVAYVEAEVVGETDCETHTVFIGKVVDCGVLTDEEPMTYAFYHEVKGGKSPKSAPTYIQDEPKASPPAKARRYVCSLCGYVYDPEKGDPDSGIAPGTPFENIPDGWVCPVCGAEKDKFEPEK